jgi:UDP-N-acetylglucosamine:LPS N-acetylglucosamine transferase/predicted metal-dependent phosphoesterase TrpH
MTKVLILTAGFGDGHNAAANHLRDALESQTDDLQVEILDPLEHAYGALNRVFKKTYRKLIEYVPVVWGGVYSMMDHAPRLGGGNGLGRVRGVLREAIGRFEPDCVVSTYSLYAGLIEGLYRDPGSRPFKFMTVVTDSTTINSVWFSAPSDFHCVADEETAAVLRANGIAPGKIKVFGFPVPLAFAGERPFLPDPDGDEPVRVLYVVAAGKRRARKTLKRLMKLPNLQVSVVAGRDPELRARLIAATQEHADRVRVLGWTNQMARLMMTHHLLVGKAGGATVHEAMAARCPMIVDFVTPGQEEGNARMIERLDLGVVAKDKHEVVRWVEKAFAYHARRWRHWRANLERVSRPDAALRLASFVLAEANEAPAASSARIELLRTDRAALPGFAARHARPVPQLLLCDFHTHTNYSDGSLTVSELVDFYGRLGFDCLCITDHVADPGNLLGKFMRWSRLTLAPEQFDEYFEVIERERIRAWRRYSMLVMTGLEFNKEGYTRKSSAHLLGVDLKAPINPGLTLKETIAQIHAQGGLAIAPHPHLLKGEFAKNTLYLWKHQAEFAPLLDAWEIANRNSLFNPISLKGLPFVANSDFHKPKHIHSWKTLIYAEKDPEAIKDCIRRNQHVAITLFRDFTRSSPAARHHFAPPGPLPAEAVVDLPAGGEAPAEVLPASA